MFPILPPGTVKALAEDSKARIAKREADKAFNTSGIIPVRYTCVVEIDKVAEKTAGGLYIPDSVQDRDKLSAQEGTLVAASPLAFTYADWPYGSRIPQPGDRILFKRYNGWLHEHDGKTFRILADEDIVAIVEPKKPAVAAAA